MAEKDHSATLLVLAGGAIAAYYFWPQLSAWLETSFPSLDAGLTASAPTSTGVMTMSPPFLVSTPPAPTPTPPPAAGSTDAAGSTSAQLAQIQAQIIAASQQPNSTAAVEALTKQYNALAATLQPGASLSGIVALGAARRLPMTRKWA